MSGHSKWSTIKRKKGASDAQRANIFTKIAREMSVAVKESGADPTTNGKLRDCIAKAKSVNMPGDNIDRCIKKAAGSDNKDSFEEMIYEGYGPCGVAVIVEALTDNRNRTAGDLRHFFDKCGGNLGQNGCVSFLFNQRGVVNLENPDGKLDEEKVMEDGFDAGAQDIDFDGDLVQIFTDIGAVRAVREELEAKGYSIASAQVEYLPTIETAIADPELQEKMSKLLDLLEDNDDVQEVWHNWDAPEEPEED
ncbi:MAG: YebC/PmpR family DNA-binding transcriptional regulator [Angelakisella sp.]